MSVSTVHSVTKARKAQGRCSKCGDPIEVGSAYRYWQPMFRSNYKVVRCSKQSCTPQMSELETSSVSNIYAAIESAEDNIAVIDVTEPGDFEQAVQDELDAIEEAIGEVAEEYQSAADEYFGGSGPNAERAEALEDAKGTIPQFSLSISEPEPCEEHEEAGETEPVEGCDDCRANVELWLDDARQEAIDSLSEIELGV